MIARRRQVREDPSRGFALLVVLWFLVLIAAIGTYLMANARTEIAIAGNILSAARAEALADAGVAQAAFKLTEASASNNWNLDGAPHRVSLPFGEAIIRLHDETGKINPNHASHTLMSALFEAAGVDRIRARRLGIAIIDWVAPETENRRLDAEQYRDEAKSYPPPHAPIGTIDELQFVLGMTPEIFDSVRSYLTIHTRTDRPERKNASPLVRQALALATRESNDINSHINDSPGNPIVPEIERLAVGDVPPMVILGAPAEAIVEIESRGLDAGGGIFVRHAVLKMDPTSPTRYVVLNWHRGELAE